MPYYRAVADEVELYEAAYSMKDLKQSTKQRFGALGFSYPAHDIETEIVAHETRVGVEIAGKLVSIAERARNLKGHGLDERWRSNSKNTRTYWDIGLYRASAATLRAAGIIGVGFRFGG